MIWKPVTEEECAYYSVPKTAPPIVSELLHRPPRADPTWGRADLPRAPDEARIRATHGYRDDKVHLDQLKGRQWVAYQIWEPTPGSKDRGQSTFRSSRSDFPSMLSKRIRDRLLYEKSSGRLTIRSHHLCPHRNGPRILPVRLIQPPARARTRF